MARLSPYGVSSGGSRLMAPAATVEQLVDIFERRLEPVSRRDPDQRLGVRYQGPIRVCGGRRHRDLLAGPDHHGLIAHEYLHGAFHHSKMLDLFRMQMWAWSAAHDA